MGDLSPHFSRSEFACPCGCGFDRPDVGLVAGLEMLRGRIGVPLRVTSGCRCRRHNAEVGGAANSRHMEGKAADVAVPGMGARTLYAHARQVVQLAGFGVNDHAGTLHVDVRPVSARWCYDADGKVVTWHEE